MVSRDATSVRRRLAAGRGGLARGWRILILGVLFMGLPWSVYAGPWMRLHSPHVTVFSQAPEKATREWVVEFEQIYAVLSSLFPEVGNGQPPLTVMLFNDRAVFRHYMPIREGKVLDVAGFFIRVSDRSYAALDVTDTRADARATIYHEAVHWFFSAQPKLRPVWLDEGMAEFFSTVRLRQGEYTCGEPVGWHLTWLRSHPALAVEKLLLITRRTPGFNENARVAPFYATSWLFLHHVFCSPDGGGVAALTNYARLQNEELEPQEAFRQAFGYDYAGMDRQLAQYVRAGKLRTFRGKAAQSGIGRELHPETPSTTEVDLELGYLLALGNRFDQARPLLGQLTQRAPRDARVYEALGIMAMHELDRDAARRHFGRALELGSRNYFCHLGPALTELAYREKGGGGLGHLEPEPARFIADGFLKTLQQEPDREEFYSSLSAALLDVRVLTAEDGRMVEQGVQRFPKNLDIRFGYATYLHRSGFLTQAIPLYEQIAETKRQIDPVTREAAWRNALNLRVDVATAAYDRAIKAEDFPAALAALDDRISLTSDVNELRQLRDQRAEIVDLRDAAVVEELRRAGRVDDAIPLLKHLARDAKNHTLRRNAETWLQTIEAARKEAK